MKLVLSLFLSVLLLRLPAQQNPFVFSHLTEKDGLSSNIIYSFLKDSRGLLWIGASDGLNLFDGSHFKVFRRSKDSSGLGSNEIHKLCEDREGKIWGSTDNGIFCYDPVNDQFQNYRVPEGSPARAVNNIIFDKKGDLWITVEHQIMKFNPVKKSIEIIAVLTSSLDTFGHFSIRKNGLIYDHVRHGFWLATRAGLAYYNITENKIRGFETDGTNKLFKRGSASALAISNKGHCWYFDNIEKKVIAFDPVQEKQLFEIDVRGKIPNAVGATIFEDNQQRLWFSSWDYTVALIEYSNDNKITILKRDSRDMGSIRADFFWAAFQDRDGTIWIGTMGGISKCNPENAIYRIINLPEIIPEVNNKFIPLIVEDPLNYSWWFSSSDHKLFNYDPQKQKYRIYSGDDALPNKSNAKPGIIFNLRIFNQRIVMCTSTGAWELSNDRLVPFSGMPKGFEDFQVHDLANDGDSVYYFSNGNDVVYWNRNQNHSSLKLYPTGADGKLRRNGITRLYIRKEVRPEVWGFNSSSDLLLLDEEKFEVKQLTYPNKTLGFYGSMEIDRKGLIWISSYGLGLIRYNPNTKEVKTFDQSDGLSRVGVQFIISDDDNRIWATSFNKISVYDQKTGAFNNFPINIEVVGTDYYTYVTRLTNGTLLSTVKNYFVEYFPGKLDDMPAVAKPLISDITVSGKSMSPESKDLNFAPDQNSVRVNFGMLTNKETFPYTFMYMLEGFDPKWVESGIDDMAVYNNLKPGNYTFRLYARGKNGRWISKEIQLRFTIETPYYETNWFRILIFVFIAAMVGIVYRYRLMQKTRLMKLEGRAQMLEKEKAMVMYENLKQQLNPHFLFNSLTSLNSLIETEPRAAREFLEGLSKTYRYILKSRDNELVALKDEIKFAETYIKLQKTRFEDGLVVKIDVPEDYHHRKLVPVSIQNLVENAIKHNVIDEESPLIIEIFIEDDQLVVKNNLQKKNFVETSNRTGLASMQSLYQYLSEKPMEIEESSTSFIVKIPLI